jgi:hypothetical protein
MPSLQVLAGPHAGTLIPLVAETIILGRARTCNIVIPLIPISRNHARIVRVGEAILIEDMQSRSGTRLNNETIVYRRPLRNRDRISICDFIAVYLDEPFAGVAATDVIDEYDGHTVGAQSGLPPLVTERQWQAANNPFLLLDHLRTATGLETLGLDASTVDTSYLTVQVLGSPPPPASQRKLRLFTCACARRLWHELGEPADQESIALAERYADGVVTDQDWEQLREKMGWNDMPIFRSSRDAHQPLSDVEHYAARQAARAVVAALGLNHQQRRGQERLRLASLLRDIFRPFHKFTIDPAWLAWQDGLVGRLAGAAYDERCLPEGTLDVDRLAVVADALEEAGCAGGELLEHLRGNGVHVRGCWAVDMLMGR